MPLPAHAQSVDDIANGIFTVFFFADRLLQL
jgi:hypothetical protein